MRDPKTLRFFLSGKESMNKKLILALCLLTIPCFGQLQSAPSITITTSGGTAQISNANGALQTSWEEIPGGGPATVSVTIQGCMKGGTCDTAADTNTATTAVIRNVTFTKPYTSFLITASWTGGTAVTMTINPALSTAQGASGSGSGTVSANNTSAGSVANYAAAGGSTTVGPTTLVWAPNSLTLGVAGGGNAVLGLPGNTSGSATFTAPAIAGTSTNAVVMTNVLSAPAGAGATPAYSFTGQLGTGMWQSGGAIHLTSQVNQLNFEINGTTLTQFFSNVETRLGSGAILGFSSAAALGSAQDTSLTRSAAGVLAIGGGSAGDTTAKVKAAGYISQGTTFTTNAGCTDTILTGGATAGKFTNGAVGACTDIITLGNSASATNGWTGAVIDQTTSTAACRITSSTGTAVTIGCTGMVAADIVSFSFIGY